MDCRINAAHFCYGDAKSVFIQYSLVMLHQASTAVTFILPLLDRYIASTDILSTLYASLTEYGPLLSVPVADLRKNTALAYMRTVMILEVVIKYRSTFTDVAKKMNRNDHVCHSL